jgi:hypothetical protein
MTGKMTATAATVCTHRAISLTLVSRFQTVVAAQEAGTWRIPMPLVAVSAMQFEDFAEVR